MGPGATVALEHRLHIRQQPGPVERFQPQRHEVLCVRRTRRRRCRRQQHAPPQLMQGRRAGWQIEAREQLFDTLEVEPAPKLERQTRSIGRHDRRQLALLDAAAAGRCPWRRPLTDGLARAFTRRRPYRRGSCVAGAGAPVSGLLGVRLEGVPTLLRRGRRNGAKDDGESQPGPPHGDGWTGGAHDGSTPRPGLKGRCRLATHLDARHGRGCLLWHGLEKHRHQVQSAEHNRARDPRDNEKPEKAWHVAKLLLAGYVPELKVTPLCRAEPGWQVGRPRPADEEEHDPIRLAWQKGGGQRPPRSLPYARISAAARSCWSGCRAAASRPSDAGSLPGSTSPSSTPTRRSREPPASRSWTSSRTMVKPISARASAR